MLWLTWLAGGLFFLAVLLNGLAVYCAWNFVKKRPFPGKAPSFKPPVSLMVPVCGNEGEGIEHFRQFCRLNWPNYQVVFSVLEDLDSALPFLRQMVSSSSCEVSLQIGGDATGANRKIRNLMNALPLARHEWIVICDADTSLEPSFLEGLMAPFLDPNLSCPGNETGLVHSLYCCLDNVAFASSWEQVWINCDFWTQGLLGNWLRGTDFAFGAAMCLHRDTLKQIGGLEVIQDYLADDYQLGHRVAALGKRLVFNREFVTLRTAPQSWSNAWKHLLRWSRTIRVCQPCGFAGSILTNVTLFALFALFVSPMLFLPWSVGAVVLRVFWANQCRNWIMGKRGMWNRWWLVPFKDMAQALLWILAFWNGPVEWRGVCYRLGSDGKLKEI